jgi:hypothetical protein
LSAYRHPALNDRDVEELEPLWDFEIWHESLFPRAKDNYQPEKSESV